MHQWKTIARKFFIGIVVCSIAGLGLWEAVYHNPGDRKDLRYQAWKLGIYPMDLDQATSTMVGDIFPDRLVVGKTREQLVKKFGYVTDYDQASDYVKYCYVNSPYFGKRVIILRRSNWMVVMNNGRATDLVLVKGC
jgi:hypothetical protein